MALSNDQKYTVLRLLGWPASTIDQTSLSYSKILSDRLDRFPAAAEGQLFELIDRVKELDVRLQRAVGRAGVKRIDDIEFFGNESGASEMPILRKERRRLLVEIASLMDIAMGPGARGSGMVDICI